MINNNRIGVDNDSETVTSNAAQPKKLCEYLKRRKVMCITFIIIVLAIIITISIVIVKTKKTNSEQTSTIEETTIQITEKIEVTTESPTTSTSTTTSTTPSKPKFNKWKQNASTVAGGNGEGQQLNQLYAPVGISIDKNKNIFIADRLNHRIVQWKYNAKEGQIIVGGNGQGHQMDQLNEPTDVIVDQQDYSIIIADQGNTRVIQWLNQTQQILIHNIVCYGLTMDKHGFLYVSDWEKNEVRRWKMGEYNNEGIVVAGGNGQGDQLNQLNNPTFIFVDEEQSVYVSDHINDRVMKWRKDAKTGVIVDGGNVNQLFYPQGVIVDDLDQIYVAYSGNDRVMRWREGKEEGETVVGGNGQGHQSNQMFSPCDLSFDDEGNLYVADEWNHRIQKFEIIL
ncbi:unnamed protein product [Adineta steineri]|uniref:NHL repeat containing protein n=1 Tax=Adineta steineri TaxID=433720 RepID=A0A814J4V5_9BILA|nr:unnamed protein product [Adineta steineri]CAF1069217.1 unnamed protein product [Adineta steineri]